MCLRMYCAWTEWVCFENWLRIQVLPLPPFQTIFSFFWCMFRTEGVFKTHIKVAICLGCQPCFGTIVVKIYNKTFGIISSIKMMFRSSLVAQLGSLLLCGFNPCLGNFRMLWAWPKKKKKGCLEVPVRCSRLRTWHCHSCVTGGNCGTGLIPDLGTFTCHGCGQRGKKRHLLYIGRLILCMLEHVIFRYVITVWWEGCWSWI